MKTCLVINTSGGRINYECSKWPGLRIAAQCVKLRLQVKFIWKAVYLNAYGCAVGAAIQHNDYHSAWILISLMKGSDIHLNQFSSRAFLTCAFTNQKEGFV